MPQPLLTAKVAFGGLNTHVTKQELDLLKFSSCCVAQPRAAAATIVGCEFLNSTTLGVCLHDVPDDLFRDTAAPCHAEPAD